MFGKILGIATFASLAFGAVPASAQESYQTVAIDRAMDTIIAADSASWLPWYKYSRGSAQSSRILAAAPNGEAAVIRTYFIYATGGSDYVTMTISTADGITCLRYESVSSPCSLAATPDYKMMKNTFQAATELYSFLNSSSGN